MFHLGVILVPVHATFISGEVYRTGKDGRKEKMRATSYKVDGYNYKVMGASLKVLKNQFGDRLSYTIFKSI